MFNSESKWIWCKTDFDKDVYGEFASSFKKEGGEKVLLKISCDSVCNVYLNGKLVAFSACADFPWYKFYDEIDITDSCKDANELLVDVWHFGEDSQTYTYDLPGVIFEVTQGDKVLCKSDESTPSRCMNEYKNGYKKVITYQLGFSYFYDNTVEKCPFDKCVVVNKSYDIHKRPIPLTKLEDRLPIKVVKTENSYLIDMGKEVAGYIELDIDAAAKTNILIAYGEHIADGCVRRKIDSRDFSVEFVAKSGNNEYLNVFRRVAGRYLEVFSDGEIRINYVGIRPANYPLTVKKVSYKDELVQKIYDTCVATLRLCMHEHYEDCPWREQALYTMDSRNQMLCGYYAFEGYEFQRHCLILISKSLRPDGLLKVNAPGGLDFPIPFFSLCYILQVCEYIQYTGDAAIMREIGPVLDTIANTFESFTESNGLIPELPAPFWNFYEWAEDSDNHDQINRSPSAEYVKTYSLILNCMYVYVMGKYSQLVGQDFAPDKRKEAIRAEFYTGEGYKLTNKNDKLSQLGNSLAVLIGLGDAALVEKIAKCEGMIPATLSMRAFVYDALLSFDEKYGEFVLDDIKRLYKNMLDKGATSFWETEKGEADFGGAGSLCHGWSAIPIIYFNKIIKER